MQNSGAWCFVQVMMTETMCWRGFTSTHECVHMLTRNSKRFGEIAERPDSALVELPGMAESGP
jgi:hypothetical protein